MFVFSLNPENLKTFYPSFCDVQFAFVNLPVPSRLTPPNHKIALVDAKALSYGQAKKIKVLRGKDALPLARAGRVTIAHATLELGIISSQAIYSALSQLNTTVASATPAPLSASPSLINTTFGGFGDVSFDLLVTYQLRPGTAVIRDALRSCKFQELLTSTQLGGRPVSTVHHLSVAQIEYGLNKNGDGSAQTDTADVS